MKKLIFLFCIMVTGVAQAAIKGEGIHLEVNDEFLSAFENCTPYETEFPNKDSLPKNKISEEYDSIQILGLNEDICVFDLIMQMSSKRLYAKMVKRCGITSEQRESLLKAMQNIKQDKGRQYLKEIADIMDQCVVVDEE